MVYGRVVVSPLDALVVEHRLVRLQARGPHHGVEVQVYEFERQQYLKPVLFLFLFLSLLFGLTVWNPGHLSSHGSTWVKPWVNLGQAMGQPGSSHGSSHGSTCTTPHHGVLVRTRPRRRVVAKHRRRRHPHLTTEPGFIHRAQQPIQGIRALGVAAQRRDPESSMFMHHSHHHHIRFHFIL